VRAVVPSLIERQRTDEAIKISERLVDIARTQGRGHLEAVGLVLLARAQFASRDEQSAAATLRAALTITSGNRATQPYVDLAPDLGTLLVRVSMERGSPQLAAHRRSVLRAIESRTSLQPSVWNTLSERERDILSALAAHNTTKAVARELGLSPETVKHHLKRIFTKLGVHSREEALERVRYPLTSIP
jgi:LuxR family transcriptional regulator, maltose regulon positive regulatory protein